MPRRDGNKKGVGRTRAGNAKRKAEIREHDLPSIWKGKEWYRFWSGESFAELSSKGLRKGRRPQ